jgi:Holliday junction resolvase
MAGKASRDKGNRAERAIVKFLQERGFAAERVPLSGSAGGSYLGDLTVPIIGTSRVVEVKARAKGFRQLYDWLVDRDILIVRADRSEPLVVLPLKLAAEIALAADKNRLRIERVIIHPGIEGAA